MKTDFGGIEKMATEIKKVILKKYVVKFSRFIPANVINSGEINIERIADQLIARTKELSPKKYQNVPLTWWDHFKQDVLKPRFPFIKVNYRTIEIKGPTTANICPHIDLPPGDPEHIEFWGK